MVMAWTKQQLGIAVAVTVLSLVSGGTAGFILGSRHQKHSAERQAPATRQETASSVADTDADEEESPGSGAVPSNGRHAGTRFLAAKRDSADADAQKKEVTVASNVTTNTNATVVAADTAGGTSRRRGSRRAP